MALAVAGIIPLPLGLPMNVYGLVGKHRPRERILALADPRGDEATLDVGVGAGFLPGSRATGATSREKASPIAATS